MKSKDGKKRLIFSRIRDRRFLKLFLRNWLLVYGSLVTLVVLCVVFIYAFSSKSLLNEMDAAVTRSLTNMRATTDSLLEEIYGNLISKAMDEDIGAFLSKERQEPKEYPYIHSVQLAKKKLENNYRDKLYYSLDAYSETGDYIISAFKGASSYERTWDIGLIDIFYELSKEMPSESVVMVPRTVDDVQLLTMYVLKSTVPGSRSFVAVSVYADELANYLSGSNDYEHGYSLLVSKDGIVALDTAGRLYHTRISLPEMEYMSGENMEIDNQQMWVACTPLNWFELTCVQVIPMEEYLQNNSRLQMVTMSIIFSGIVIAAFISYGVSGRLYRPIEVVLGILENPFANIDNEGWDDEIQYILMSVLELFQKNTDMEEQMLERAVSLRRVRAKALQEQMSPHFLYNVLQIINWNAIVETGTENSMTSKSIMLLAELLKFGKEQRNNITTVAEEIEYIKKYIQLACFRYGPDLQCTCYIEDAVKEMPIPCVSLQTLVENSITHGLQPKGAKGSIVVSVTARENQGMCICVEDDGVGFSENKIEQIFDMLEAEYIYRDVHVGIINLFQRFRLIYGNDCRFDIRNRVNGGACVEIILPKLPDNWLGSHDKK